VENNYIIKIVDGHHVVTILPKDETDWKALATAIVTFSEAIKNLGKDISRSGQEMTKRHET
jgi:hypothetical protein